MVVATWVLVLMFGNGNSNQKIEGYDTEVHCQAAKLHWNSRWGVPNGGDQAFCIPKWEAK